MKLVTTSISKAELKEMSQHTFGSLVKAVVDINKEIMVVDAELHADEEAYLLEHGSEQVNLWGITIYPQLSGADFIEFDSMINLRPNQGNMSRGVDDANMQHKIIAVVQKLVL